jgi:hypothetical protein
MDIKDQPAFPTLEHSSPDWLTTPGMTLRQYYAGQAMMGIIASVKYTHIPYDAISENCVKATDALIKALEVNT